MSHFLDPFPQAQKGWLGALFNRAVREGNTDIESVIVWVRNKADSYLKDPFISDERRDLLESFVAVLNEPDAIEFAQYVLHYEGLLPEEKARLKQKNKDFKSEWLQSQQPTEKQLQYLKTLGCATVPINRQQASELIDQFLKKKNSKGDQAA
jgi:hypothetical protein